MNTPEPKPRSLIAALAIAISDIHLRLMSQDKYKNHRFASKDSLSDSDIAVRESTLTTSITEAVKNTTPMPLPTKHHLRSFLSVTPILGRQGIPEGFSLDGFDELYNEVQETMILRTISAMTGYDKLFNESLEKSDLIAKQAEKIAILEYKLTHSIELSEKRSARVNDLLEQNDALQEKNEELVGLPQKYHWDENDIPVAGTATTSAGRDNIAAEKLVANILARPQPFHAWSPIVLVMHDTTEVDKLKKDLAGATEYSQRANADCETYAENAAKWQKEAELSRSTLVRVSQMEKDARGSLEDLRKLASTDAQHLHSQIAKLNATIEDLTFSLKERAYGDVSKIQHDVSAILSEFKIDSPTNSIPDMVRSACEATRQHPQTAADMDATAIKNSRGMTGYATVPERQYAGGIPRQLGTYGDSGMDADRMRGMVKWKGYNDRLTGVATAITLLGSAFALCYLAVKYMGLFQ